jgi:hypothetical protein
MFKLMLDMEHVKVENTPEYNDNTATTTTNS